MPNKFIEVPVDAIAVLLTSKGFVHNSAGSEVTFVRCSKGNARVKITVYSSVAKGKATARAKDTDAIRVVLSAELASGKSFGMTTQKILRVNSVAGVLDRIWSACVAAAEEAKVVAKTCPFCQSPAYTDSGKCLDRKCRDKHWPPKGWEAACPGCHEKHPARSVNDGNGQPIPDRFVMKYHRRRSDNAPCGSEGAPVEAVDYAPGNPFVPAREKAEARS